MKTNPIELVWVWASTATSGKILLIFYLTFYTRDPSVPMAAIGKCAGLSGGGQAKERA